MTAEVLELLCRELERRRRRRLRDRRPARPRRPVGALRPRPARPEGRAVGAADPARARSGSDAAARLLPRAAATATCSCTTRTTRSPPRSRRSSSRPRATRSVLAIKQTLYRTGGARARIVASLIQAAEAGKQVVALVELKARFDEQANIEWARVLEEAGVHVVYGLVGLKTHAKVAARRAPGGRRHPPLLPRRHRQLQPEDRRPLRGPRPAHAPTPTSAPTSPSCSTTSPATAARARYRKLLVAPDAPAARASPIASSSEAATGAAGRIIMKMNSLVDPSMIDALYAASQRGRRDRPHRARHLLPAPRRARACPRTSGCGRSSAASSSTRGSSASAPSPTTAEYLIGSADLMPRNLDRRVEALAPVTDPELQRPARGDPRRQPGRRRARLGARRRRHWTKVPTTAGISTHRALAGAGGRPGPRPLIRTW